MLTTRQSEIKQSKLGQLFLETLEQYFPSCRARDDTASDVNEMMLSDANRRWQNIFVCVCGL